MGDEFDISKLLHQRGRHQPPQEYFDQFLRDFRRRQRAELIQRSTRQVLWERICALMPTFHVPQMAYAAIAVLAVSASALILTRQPAPQQTVVASAQPAAATFSLTSSKPVTIGDTLAASARPDGVMPSHYVLQARPVSNEQPLSF
jgi:hypothetical protein